MQALVTFTLTYTTLTHACGGSFKKLTHACCGSFQQDSFAPAQLHNVHDARPDSGGTDKQHIM